MPARIRRSRPFVFLYGMWEFVILAVALIGGGVLLGLELPHAFTPGGWFTGAVLLAFALTSLVTSRREAPAKAP